MTREPESTPHVRSALGVDVCLCVCVPVGLCLIETYYCISHSRLDLLLGRGTRMHVSWPAVVGCDFLWRPPSRGMGKPVSWFVVCVVCVVS